MDGRQVPNQIPGATPHYVNHKDELSRAERVIAASAGNSLVVFGGLPGTGKTATAVELSSRLADGYSDGRLFARLSMSIDEAGAESEVLHGFLGALGVPAQEIPDRLDARRALWQSLTTGRSLQIVLDGAMSAGQVRTLLPGQGTSLVLVTEGRPLSMLMADTPYEFVELSPLTDEAARELLVRLVGEARVAAEPAAVSDIVSLCGYLPIALCIVGAMLNRSRTRTFTSMAGRLSDERRRLVALSSHGDLSVSAVFTAAYRQLGDSAQRIYRALGLRPRTGEVTAEALTAALDLPGYEVVEALEELADFRLIDETATDNRFVVRELVQLHAAATDTRPDEERELETSRLLEFFLQRCVDADELIAPSRPWRRLIFPELSPTDTFADSDSARRWLRTERANLLAAVVYSQEVGQFQRVLQWCVLLWPFYEKEKLVDDLLSVHRCGLIAARRMSNPFLRSLVNTQIGFAHYWLRDLDDAADALTHALTFATQETSAELEATACEGLGLVELARHRDGEALSLLRRNLELGKTIRDLRRIALASLHLAKTERPETALVLLDAAEDTFVRSSADESENIAKTRTWRGIALTELGRFDEARESLGLALDTMSARDRRFDEAVVLVAMGDLGTALGERHDAERHYREALVCYEDLGFRALVAQVRDRLSALDQP